MIQIPADQIFIVFAAMWIIILAVLWLRDEIHRSYEDWTTAKDRLYICSRCHYSFLAKDDTENITRCPRCNEMCFLKKKKHF